MRVYQARCGAGAHNKRKSKSNGIANIYNTLSENEEINFIVIHYIDHNI